MIEADSSETLQKACQYELKTESTKERSPTELRCASFPARYEVTWGAVKGRDERPCSGAPLTAPHVTTGGLCRWKAINKVGRHVGLDFYDLLIEGVSTSLRFTFACLANKGRVENRRSSVSLPVAHNAAFARVASVRLGMALFPVPAHRTEQARFAHSALGESVTRSPTES